METIRNLNRPDRFLSVAIALLTATCGMPPRAWCAGTNLWTSSYGAGVDSYNSIQLKKNGAPTPLELGTYPDANGLAFDSSHNLWVVVFDPDGNLVLEYTAAQLKNLKHDPGPTPAAIISSTGSFEYPLGCNFDFQGNLWIADPENDSIDELSKAQLAAGSGNVTPAVVVGSSIPGRPNFVTFDKAGNAWTGIDNEPNSEIAEFSASQLTSSGIRTPTIVLTDDGSGSSIAYPGEIAFDKDGNLWVPNYGAQTVVEYAGYQLTSSGNPPPLVKLDSAEFDGPWGAVFDNAHDLVVTNYGSKLIMKFTPRQLKASGGPIPRVSVSGSEPDNFQITFGPAS